jgi:hypothetical protein
MIGLLFVGWFVFGVLCGIVLMLALMVPERQ